MHEFNSLRAKARAIRDKAIKEAWDEYRQRLKADKRAGSQSEPRVGQSGIPEPAPRNRLADFVWV